MTDKEFEQKVKEARKNVASFDKIDGFKDRYAKSIMAALKCGIQRPETNAQFDAYAMLEDIKNENFSSSI